MLTSQSKAQCWHCVGVWYVVTIATWVLTGYYVCRLRWPPDRCGLPPKTFWNGARKSLSLTRVSRSPTWPQASAMAWPSVPLFTPTGQTFCKYMLYLIISVNVDFVRIRQGMYIFRDIDWCPIRWPSDFIIRQCLVHWNSPVHCHLA